MLLSKVNESSARAKSPMRVVPSAVMKRAVILAGVVVIEIVMAIVLVPSTDHARMETTDFLNFYVGTTIVRKDTDGLSIRRRLSNLHSNPS